MEEEIWKSIEGYEKDYQAISSSTSNVLLIH